MLPAFARVNTSSLEALAPPLPLGVSPRILLALLHTTLLSHVRAALDELGTF